MTGLDDDDFAAVDAIVAPSDAALAAQYPGDAGSRQPVHTVYVPADRATPNLVREWGSAALAAVKEHAPGHRDWCSVMRRDMDDLSYVVKPVDRKLKREPIEDLRIDFEDGYGPRPDDEEDAHAASAVAVLAGARVPFCGIRVKSLEAATRRRGLRTLDLVVGGLIEGGGLPDGWVVTLPKVSAVEQVLGMAEACSRLEAAHGLAPGRLRFEVQVETPQAVLGADGTSTVARLVHAGA
ncbi:MAG TPA: aldolase, partial [Actinomycetales bacterium]|nr:aldolase [Actinomycetales bacterium]